MAKKKKYKGHYCKVCGEIKANEKFSGKGHRNHICKKCSKKTGAQQAEEIAINRIYKLAMYSSLSKQNRKMLEKYIQDERERVRLASEEVMEMFTYSYRNNSFKEEGRYFFDENYEDYCDDLEDDELFYFESEEEDGILQEEYDSDDIPF